MFLQKVIYYWAASMIFFVQDEVLLVKKIVAVSKLKLNISYTGKSGIVCEIE